MRSLILALAILSLGCSRTTGDDKKTVTPDEVIQMSGSMKLERPENQIGVRSALPVLTEQKVTIELRDKLFGNASQIKIAAGQKVWNLQFSGNKSVATKPFAISTMADNQEIQIKGTRTEKSIGQRTATTVSPCQKRVEMSWQCNPPTRCGYSPVSVRGQASVTTTFQDIEVKYDFELSDQVGKIATIAADPVVVSRAVRMDTGACQ